MITRKAEAVTSISRNMLSISGNILRASFLMLATCTWSLANHSRVLTVDDYPERSVAPYFMSPGLRNITVSVGQTGYLHCRVAQLGNQAQVSWIRKQDLHVLSSGSVVFANDQRFRVIHPHKSDNWTLQIKYVKLRDAGIYECQVNTEPKIFLSYTLSVVESQTVIVGPTYVKVGSTINLTCIISQTSMPGLIYWYRGNKILDYNGPVRIWTFEDRERRTSHLTIQEAKITDSGNYTCYPTSAHTPASVIISVVLEGEQPAAMQTSRGITLLSSLTLVFLQVKVILII